MNYFDILLSVITKHWNTSYQPKLPEDTDKFYVWYATESFEDFTKRIEYDKITYNSLDEAIYVNTNQETRFAVLDSKFEIIHEE